MRKIILSIIVLTMIFITNKTYAQNPSSNASMVAQSPDLSKQIDDLKNKVASKVAQLKLVEKRGLVGVVADTTATQITINDLNSNIRIIDVDEFTKFSSPDAKASFGISDIKRGDKIGVLGLYNKESRRTLARFVNVLDIPEFVVGVVAVKDEENFNLTVATSGRSLKVSIENISKVYDVDSNGKLLRSGFSKITLKENIIVSGFFGPKLKDTITAGRVLLFPGVAQNPQIEIKELPASPSIVPSTGSGRKLTPIVR
jgi:acetolactate synthase regulatory subunit